MHVLIYQRCKFSAWIVLVNSEQTNTHTPLSMVSQNLPPFKNIASCRPPVELRIQWAGKQTEQVRADASPPSPIAIIRQALRCSQCIDTGQSPRSRWTFQVDFQARDAGSTTETNQSWLVLLLGRALRLPEIPQAVSFSVALPSPLPQFNFFSFFSLSFVPSIYRSSNLLSSIFFLHEVEINALLEGRACRC